jgi:hypothetical protein
MGNFISRAADSISAEYHRTDDQIREGWADWGQEAAQYAAITGIAALGGAAVAGGVGVAAGVGYGANVAIRGTGAESEAKQTSRDMRKLSRAQARFREQQAKGVGRDDAARRRQQRLASAYGRSDTILTGPLGLTGSPASAPVNRLIGA